MDKATKYYKKALAKYHNGYIDEAIDLCGVSISENKKFKAAASLKGVLYYFKGDLENARELWDFNVRINKDVVSQKYIENTRNDDELLSIFAEAVHLVEEVKISEALKLLRKCEVSDFNVINVSNYIAVCLIKQGEYDKAWVYLEKVLNIDKKNVMALDNIKMLRKYGIIEKKFNFSYVIPVLVVFLIAGSSLTYFNIRNSNKHTKKTNVVAQNNQTKTTKPNTQTKPATPAETKPEAKTGNTTSNEEKFSSAQVKKDIDSSNYDNMYNDVIKWQDKSLASDEKALIDNAKSILKNNAVEYFYNKGRSYSKANDFKNAADYYYKAYYFGKSDWYEHCLFYLASSYEALGNVDNAVKYYLEYSNAFPEGSYEDTVLYNLAMIYKGKDIAKSKQYAELLSDRFSDSIYFNSNIRSILSQ